MAPTRKPRSVNKRFSSLNEVSPEKDGVNSNKNKQRKQKLSDKLGSQWNKEELERFYEAYRKYGKEWKKVAAVLRNRSIEMVEALYNMNRAYLSLPEGTASVVGLVAMMTDHYNVLEESDSERESNDILGSQKSVKRKRGKNQLSVSKDSVQSQSIASNDGCLSLLKRRRFDGSQPRAVGKRTPRIPVNYSYKKDDRENYVSPDKRSLKSVFDAHDDEVAHVAALALTEAAQRGGSPQVSQMPYRRSEQKSSAVQSWERMHQGSETVPVKFDDASVDEEECLEDSIESKKSGEYARYTEGLDSFEVFRKGKKNYGKKGRVETFGNHLRGNGGEACSGPEGCNFSLKEKVDIEVTNAKPEQFSLKGLTKKDKKLFFGDGNSSLDALQTLADLSLMIPPSTMESESSVQLKEDKTTFDKDEKSVLPEGTSSQNKDKCKLSDLKQKVVHAIPGVDVSTSKKPKLGRESVNGTNALFKSNEQLISADRTWKRKRKSMDSEAINEESKLATKGKHTDQVFTLAKQLKSVRSSEGSLCNDQKDLRVSSVEIPIGSEVNLSTKLKSKQMTSLRRTRMPKEKSSENISKSKRNKYLTNIQDWTLSLEEKLSGCLSPYLVRRWCRFEWFYSAIDYPWFSKREFTEYLNHVGLGNIPRLTRIEWSVIKGSLGKPRRFSERFLQEEKQKLKQYRESVREHYTELWTGIRDGLPTDLAKPLYVGQRVLALHSKTKEIHDGSVLTVDNDKCMVQFDRPELGVELVMDIDCMPMNPMENMPEALKWHISARKAPWKSKEPQMKGNSSIGGCLTCASSGPVEKEPTSSTLFKQEKGDVNNAVDQTKDAIIDQPCTQQAVCSHPCMVINDQTMEADIHVLSELTRALDKKVSSALLDLRQRNTHTGNSPQPSMRSPASFTVSDGLPIMSGSSITQELGSTVIEIIKGSRLKAHTMVDAAFQALSSTKEGEDAFMRIGQVLDSFDYQQLATNSRLPVIRSQEQHDSNKIDTQIPSDLITSCVGTLIMIQTCTERQYPPADVAQILDSAVTSLHPRSSQNLPIYREIQMCMGRIKTQILALIPT